MPKAAPPGLSPRLNLQELRFKMDAETRKLVAKTIGLKVLDETPARTIEEAVLHYRAYALDPTTPGTSIAAIREAISPKLQKRLIRAMQQFTDENSGVDPITCLVLEPHASACLRALVLRLIHLVPCAT